MSKREAVKKVLVEIQKRGANYVYFFDSLKSADWAKPLAEAGFFKHPPELVRDEATGSSTFPQWPESRYLARIAAEDPNTVCDIILQVPPTQNILIHADFIQAAIAMPPDLAAKMVPSAKSWIESPYQLFLPDELGKLMAKLARGGEVDAAFDLASALLDILPDPRASREDKVVLLLPRAHFDVWHYEQIIKNNVPALIDIDDERCLKLFCDLLEKVIRLSAKRTSDNEVSEDHSWIWRSAIEEHSQNQEKPHELNDILVSLIRDTAYSMMQIKGESVLKAVESRAFKVFKRIGLYLRNALPDIDPCGTNRIILDSSYAFDPDFHHEFFQLLKNHFGGLPDEVKRGYLSLLEREADQRREDQVKEGEPKERVDQTARYWHYKRLYPIQEYLLEEWSSQFKTLRKEFGEIEHPDFLSYMSSTWVGPTSPKSADELREMDIAELAAFLKSWKPSGKWMDSTPEGLGRELSSIVSSEPERYASRANEFEGVSPTYIRHVITGFREARKQKKLFVWEPILQLCQWAVSQQSEIETGLPDFDDDSRWGPTRQAIADLMSAGLQAEEGEIPFSDRETVWRILELIADDPEPTVEYEAKYGGANMSPMMLSINTVRGCAMHAVVSYAIWVRHHEEQESDAKKFAAVGFNTMPEVRELLERHLNPEYDRALAIRSVYGESFPTFIWLDRKWATENLSKIFPTEESLSDLRDAAWDTYVSFCRPYDDVFNVLSSEYRKAIEQLTADAVQERGLENPSKHLAEHLMVFYWREKLEFDQEDSLLSLFYLKAPVALREHALEYIGHVLHNKNMTPSGEILERLRSFLERRLQAAHEASSSDSEELVPFGWWFSSQKFDDTWAIARLKGVLELTGRIELDHIVVESLASLADKMPLEVVDCLRLMVIGAKENWRIYHWREKARIILSSALRAANPEPRQAAKDLVNQLGALGFFEFRDLLSQPNS